MAKKVNITLIVEASSLYALQRPAQADIDPKCSLSDDNHGNSTDGTLENFQSNVYINHDVRWTGKTKDPGGVDEGFSVRIDGVDFGTKNNAVNFFDNATLNGSGGRSGNVITKVKNDRNLVNKLNAYNITFSIYPKGNGPVLGPFSIDPKLMGNP